MKPMRVCGPALLWFCALLVPRLAAQKLEVYILAGQSNMQGQAKVSTFDYIGDDPATAPLLAEMRGKDGKPRVCDRVWIAYLTGAKGGNGEGFGKLTAGYGARRDPAEDGGKIGPEFTFGLRMEKAHKGPVLLIKTAWGGKSLHTDFRPPSTDKAGRYYSFMVDYVKKVLGDIGRVCPAYDPKRGYELAGFVWFQGWNDMVDRRAYPKRAEPGGYDRYSDYLAHFIKDVRKDLDVPGLPFVIGVMGVNGRLDPKARYAKVHGNFRAAMAAPAALPEFQGNVTAVQTAPYWDAKLAAVADKLGKVRHMARMLRTKNKNYANKDGTMSRAEQRAYVDRYRDEVVGAADAKLYARGASNGGYHYLGCAKTMALIGQAFAEAILAMRR